LPHPWLAIWPPASAAGGNSGPVAEETGENQDRK